jgi:NADH-quinone oxidoreductase subunit H
MDLLGQVGTSALVLAFSFIVGVLLQGIERKLFARMQNRIGPPLLQPLYDILKLFSKETLVPRNSVRSVFILAPLVSVASICTAALLVPLAGVSYWGFAGDVIVLLYVIVLSSIGIVLGASASGSPFAAIGASREITLIISFELPLALAVLSAAFLSKSFSLTAMAGNASFLLALGAIAYLACMLGELARAPFHIAEAETEIVEGIYTEYTGRLLGAYKIAEAMKFYVFPMLFAALFVPIPQAGVAGMLALQLAFALAAVVLVSIVAAVSARFKIHQAAGFYLKGVLALAALQMAVAVFI